MAGTRLKDGALLIDCLITEQEGRDLAAWVKSHGTEPDYVYITYPHGDHLVGLPEIRHRDVRGFVSAPARCLFECR